MLDAENAPENPESTPTLAPAEGTPGTDAAPAAEKPAKKAAAKKTTAKKAAAKRTTAKRATKKAAAEPAPPTDAPAPETAPAAETTPEAQTLPEAGSAEADSGPAPAKKTAKKAATKKAAAKKTTAKRATKKAAAAAPAEGAGAEPAAAADGDTASGQPATPPEDATSAPLVMPLFKAPEPTEKPAARRKKAAAAKPEEAPAESPAEQPAEPEGDRTETEESDEGEGTGASRRRRRRGGRRRRKSGGDSDTNEDTQSDVESSEDAATPDQTGEDGAGESSSSRRRRRRRRSGEDADSGGDEPENTVTRVRKPRNAEDEITALSGSTRLEAKKQRRREGREAGRRRAPIVSEAEFLARREAVDRVMVIRQKKDLTQIAVLEDKVLVEHYVARESQTSLIGNVYLGRVQNVLPSMEAAFIDIGKGRNAVLYAGEVNWDALGAKDGQPRKIESVLKSGQTVLVQVTKDPIGHKGARLTSQISLPGRFLVYVPDGTTSGISRKLPDTERTRLKTLLKEIVPDTAGVIVRTAAEGASEEELTRDVERLTARWDDIQSKAKGGNAPQLLYGEPDLTLKVVRDLFTEDFAKLVVAGDDAWGMVDGYVAHVAPDLADRLERYDGDQDVFAAYRIDEQIAKGLDRKVWLPSGGSLIIDRTEAMTVVDVNTGKFTGSGGNLEETVTKNNLEAAEEIVRQLRLRDIGGIIVVDFIDMVLESNRDLVLRRMVECLGRDRTRHQVAEVTSLGLVQMTRKRIGTGLLEAFSETCEHCQGRGLIVHHEPVETRKKADEEPRRSRRSGRSRGRDDSGDSSAPSPKDVAAMAKPDAEKADTAAPESDTAGADASTGTGKRSGDKTKRTSKRTSAPREAEPMTAETVEPKAAEPTTAEPQAAAPEQAPEKPTAASTTRTRRRAAKRPQGPAGDTAGESAGVISLEPAKPESTEAPPTAPDTTTTGAAPLVPEPATRSTDGQSPAAPKVVTSVRQRGAARRPAGPPAGATASASEEASGAGSPTKDATPAARGADVPVDGLAAEVAVDAPEPAAAAHVPVKKKGRKR